MGAFQATNDDAKMATGDALTPDQENIYYSLGGGLPINFGVGFGVAENVMFNANFCYWLGSAVTVTDADVSADLGQLGTLSLTGTAVAQSNQFRFNPGFTFGSESGLYARTGLIIPLGGKTTVTIETDQSSPLGSVTTKEVQETTGNFSIGASTAIGYAFGIADGMKLAFELQALALNIQGATSTIVSFEDNQDGDMDSEYPNTIDRETTFVDMLDGNSNNPDYNGDVDVNSPLEDFAQRQSFGAWGLNVSFIYVIGG